MQVNVIKIFIKLPQTDTLKNMGPPMDPCPLQLPAEASWFSLSVKINDLVWPTEETQTGNQGEEKDSELQSSTASESWILQCTRLFIQCLSLLTTWYLQSALSLANFLISSFWIRQMRQSLIQAQVFGFLELSNLSAAWQQEAFNIILDYKWTLIQHRLKFEKMLSANQWHFHENTYLVCIPSYANHFPLFFFFYLLSNQWLRRPLSISNTRHRNKR